MELWKRVSDNLQRFTRLNVIAWVKRLASSNFIYKRHNARTVRQSPNLVTSSLYIHILNGFKTYLLIKLSLINSQVAQATNMCWKWLLGCSVTYRDFKQMYGKFVSNEVSNLDTDWLFGTMGAAQVALHPPRTGKFVSDGWFRLLSWSVHAWTDWSMAYESEISGTP